jgi:hypothetical protein
MHLLDAHRAGKEPDAVFHHQPEDEDEDIKEIHLAHLDSAVEKNTLEKPMTTYSGIGFDPAKIMNDKGHLHIPCFTSATLHRGVALMYAAPTDSGHHVIQIRHKKGSAGLYIGDNEDLSPFMQKEFIMPRGTTLKIDKTPEIHHDASGTPVHVWKATRIKERQ